MTNQLSQKTLKIDMDEESKSKKQRVHRLNPSLEALERERKRSARLKTIMENADLSVSMVGING